MFDKKSGVVSARKAYELIVFEHLSLLKYGILKKVWDFNFMDKGMMTTTSEEVHDTK